MWPEDTRAKLGGARAPKIAEVRAVFLQAYPELTDMRGIGWPQVQRLESEAIGMAMDRLRAQAVPALPVHDSLIVPVGATELAKWYMEQACTEVAGFRPVEPKVTFGVDNRGEMAAAGGVEGVAGQLPIQGAVVLSALAKPEVVPAQP